MPLDVTSLGIDAIAAKSQGATDFNPALLGTLLGKSPAARLFFTIFLARKEAQSNLAKTVGAVVMVPVPDVTGEDMSDAVDSLSDLGLVVTMTGKHDGEKDEGVVLKQSIAKNTSVPKGTPINLVVSLGSDG